MSLKSFLQDKGFIEKDNAEQKDVKEKTTETASQVEPTYFPIHDLPSGKTTAGETSSPVIASSTQTNIDQAFIKFFEDELTRSNFPGPDYFEFRKQMAVMNEKIGKGTPPDVILHAVLTSFEAQNIATPSLIETANKYKALLEKKKEEFLSGAKSEKDKQLKKRQDAMQTHQDSVNKMQNQLVQLQAQMTQLQDMIKREQTQMEVDKTLGKEGIEKIERAEKQITLAYEYIATSINSDIRQLQSA